MKTNLLFGLLLFVAGTLQASTEPQYAPVVQMLEKFIEHEMTDKELPAVSIALVDDQQIVWSRGFGFARPNVPATADTVYRVGLDPPGLSFEPTREITKNLAAGYLWTIDGRVFEAPAPADGLYTTVGALGRFLSALFAGKVAERKVDHDGTIPGFVTTLKTLPDDKIGVVVLTNKDAATAVTRRIADLALKAMLAVRRQQPLPEPVITAPVDPQLARRIVGRYMSGNHGIDLIESGGTLSLLAIDGGRQTRVRSLGDVLIVDDRLSYGETIIVRPRSSVDEIVFGGKTLKRVSGGKPPEPPTQWTGLIGEYGADYGILYIFEKDKKLWALTNWFEFHPLEQVSANVFRYDGERLVFTRDAGGRATAVTAANVFYPRRKVGPEEGAPQLRVTPVRPIADLFREANAADPPQENGEFRTSDLVEPTALDPSIKLEVRYATTNNFLSTVFYSEARAFLQRPAAEALVRAHRKLKKLGYGVLIHDAYRPWYVTKMFWDAVPENLKLFVADPSQGSRHNRGAAVDLTLYDSASGKPVQMVSTYDETTDRAAADYPGGTSLQRWHRNLLREAMESEGFTVYGAEWWHFDYRDWRSYPIQNVRFEKIGGAAAAPADTNAYIAKAMSAFGAPGLSLAIVEDGRTVVARGYGVRSIMTKAPVDEHTAFPIGSESKAFTTAALAILVDRGKLKWTDRVVDRLPGFQMHDPYVTEHMTVVDLLTHRSGLRMGQGDLLIVPTTNRTRADVVHALRYLKPATGFREQYAYDNVLYIVAGALVESVSGQTWEDFVRQNIFVPLNMKDSFTTDDPAAPNGVALHARLDGPMRGMGTLVKLERGLDTRVPAPAGGISLSAVDMASWMAMLLNRGKLPNGKQLLSEDALRMLWTPVAVTSAESFPGPMALANPHLQAYALGWFVEDYRGHPVIQHTGGVLGALSALYLVPDKHLGIAVSINSEDT
ncbi:MAG TPA: serine hydrolase, partial [Thermoanaerobaculia bacterium]|nr:serine hydrolase [Thermoanaerobaculia bacterium]